MNELFEAIYSEASNDSDLWDAIGGRFFLGKADADLATSYPYIVVHEVSGTPSWTFDSTLENEIIQFSIWDKSGSQSGTYSANTVLDIYNKLTTVFDWAQLTITDYNCVQSKRQSQILQMEDDVWHYAVRYLITIQST